MPTTTSPARTWARVALTLAALGPAPAFGQTEAESLSASFRKASQRVLPAVVTVRPAAAPASARRVPRPVPFPIAPGDAAELALVLPAPPSDGSGVVVDAAKGLILTNDHLVESWPARPLPGAAMPRVVVVLPDGGERVVKEVYRDPKSDLALLKVDPEGLQQAEWGDSEALEIGDWVLAIGQPFGLSGTVTAGIVSGKGRGVGMALYEDLIQTDAAINPGNSGGPLVNLKGEVVAINAAIKSRNGGNEGVGLAIPSSRARRVAADLAEHGRVRRAYIGVAIRPVDSATAATVGNPGAVEVTNVIEGSPAFEAGLRAGTVIMALDGKPVRGVGGLQTTIEVAPVGEPLTLTVHQGGQSREAQVRPAHQPEDLGISPPSPTLRPGRIVPPPDPRPDVVPTPEPPEEAPVLELRPAEPRVDVPPEPDIRP